MLYKDKSSYQLVIFFAMYFEPYSMHHTEHFLFSCMIYGIIKVLGQDVISPFHKITVLLMSISII